MTPSTLIKYLSTDRPSNVTLILFILFVFVFQDKVDDLIVGVKSSALTFGKQTKQWLTGFAATTASFVSLHALNNNRLKVCNDAFIYY